MPTPVANARVPSSPSALARANSVLNQGDVTSPTSGLSHTGGTAARTGSPRGEHGATRHSVSLRDKAELRSLVQRNERFAAVLEETTNSAMSKLKPDVDAGQTLKFQAEFMWRTLLLMWEIEGTLDASDPLHPKLVIEQLKEENELFRDDLDDCRRCYLKELTAMRDQIRVLDSRQLQHIRELVHGSGSLDDGPQNYTGSKFHEQPVMFYEPTRYLNENLKHFVAEVVEEKLKLLLFRIAEDEGDPVERERRRSLLQMAADAEKEKNAGPTARERELEEKVNELEELAKAYATELENISAGMNNFAKDSKKNEQSAAVTRIEHNIQGCKMTLSRHVAAKEMVAKKLEMRTKQLERQSAHLEERRKEGADPGEIMQLSQACDEIEAEITSLKEQIAAISADEAHEQEELNRFEAELEAVLAKEAEEARLKDEREREKEQKQQERDMALMQKEKELEEAKRKTEGSSAQVNTGGENKPLARQETQLRSAVGKMLPKPGQTFKQYRTKMLLIRAVMSSMHQSRKEALQKNAELECALERERKKAEDAVAEMERMAMKMLMSNARRKGKGAGGSDAESRKEAEEKVRAEMAAEMERMRKEMEENSAEEVRRQSKGREQELEAIIAARDREIKRLKEEIERLQAALQELQMQIENLLADPKKAREGAMAMRKRLGEQLNWVVKSSHENVFERLYHDAIDRLTRMEVLRQTFMKMQREQLVDLIQHEEDCGHLGGGRGGVTSMQGGNGASRDSQQAAYQIYLADELQKLKREQQLPTHNRWGNPMTDAELLKRAREQLDTLYPMGVPNVLPETLGPRLRPLSGPSGTGTAERQHPIAVDDLQRYPVHNNFIPGVANFGALDFRESAAKFQDPARGGRASSGPRHSMTITSLNAPSLSPPPKPEPGTNFFVIPQVLVSAEKPRTVQEGELVWASADGIRKQSGSRQPSASRSPRGGRNSPDLGAPGGASPSNLVDSVMNAPISSVLQQFSYPHGGGPGAPAPPGGAGAGSVPPNTVELFGNMTTSSSAGRVKGARGSASSIIDLNYGAGSRGSTRPSTAGGNLSSAAPSRPYSAVRKPSKRWALDQEGVSASASGKFPLSGATSAQSSRAASKNRSSTGQLSRPESGHLGTVNERYKTDDPGAFERRVQELKGMDQQQLPGGTVGGGVGGAGAVPGGQQQVNLRDQSGGRLSNASSNSSLPKARHSAGPLLFYNERQGVSTAPARDSDIISLGADSPDKPLPSASRLWAHSRNRSSGGGAMTTSSAGAGVTNRPKTATQRRSGLLPDV
mmetsp:Transcript_13868/g.34239  ORF Transcript_13868/g.34239 Transcript_13868/m.34239 type:complete len:1281 (+) Transcript_13868:655-4497(+)